MLVVSGCSKEPTTACAPLKAAMTANNLTEVKNILTDYINKLPNNSYTEANILQLTKNLSGECELTSGTYCYDCIMTLPSETEIYISFSSGAGTVKKTIDLTYNSANKIIFWNMHD
jgi:hypothetical protein